MIEDFYNRLQEDHKKLPQIIEIFQNNEQVIVKIGGLQILNSPTNVQISSILHELIVHLQVMYPRGINQGRIEEVNLCSTSHLSAERHLEIHH